MRRAAFLPVRVPVVGDDDFHFRGARGVERLALDVDDQGVVNSLGDQLERLLRGGRVVDRARRARRDRARPLGGVQHRYDQPGQDGDRTRRNDMKIVAVTACPTGIAHTCWASPRRWTN